MRISGLIFAVVFSAGMSCAGNIPIFNLPANDYQLFSHKIKAIDNTTQLYNTIDTNNILVNGIFKTHNGYFVLINHKVYKKGNIVNGYKVKTISKDKVVFSKDGAESIKFIDSKSKLLLLKNNTVSNDNSSKR